MRISISEEVLEKLKVAKPIFIRYFLYGFALIESFTLPKLIDEYNYSQYEYFKNFIFIFPYFLLGAHNGYVYLRYSFKVDYYQQLFSVGIIVLILVSGVFAILFHNLFLFLPLIIIGVYTIAEQYLKIQRQFTIIFLYKPLLSVITVSMACIAFMRHTEVNYNILLSCSFGLSFLIWYLLCPNKEKVFPYKKYNFIQRFTVFRYGYMIKVYFTGVLAQLIFTLLIFFERYYTEKYYPASIATYSFAFNLSQIVVMILGAISYVTSVELGERMDVLNRTKLKNQFLKATVVYLVFLVLFTGFIYLILPFYSEFDNLLNITLLVTYAKGFFFLVGTVSHLVVYHGFNTLMFKGLSLLFIIEAIIVYILIYLDIPLTVLLFVDSLILLSYALFLLHIVFNKVKYSPAIN